MTTKEGVLILNNRQIEQKIRRIAFQIYENNLDENEIIIAGIAHNGFVLAKKIDSVLQEISPLSTTLCQVNVHKPDPLREINTSIEPSIYRHKSVVLIDDVLNSGATLIYGCKHFLEVPLKKLQTAVLVDRSHKKYPVKVDFKGISLSTSLNETVQVTFAANGKVELL